MATSLTWVTPPGSIANFSIGNPSTTKLMVADTSNTGATVTYSKISGDLPPGLTLSSTGIISGTPQYVTSSNNYFISLDYEFIVRVISSDGQVLDGKFTIIITNTVNQDFQWTTPEGILGTIPNGNFYSLTIQAESSAGLGITYSLVSGELPPGMQLISHRVTKTIITTQFSTSTTIKVSNTQTISINDYVFGSKIAANTRVADINAATNTVTLTHATTSAVATGDTVDIYSPGLLQGVPTILDPIKVNESRSYRFTVRATNSLDRITDRAFSLNVTNIYGPIIEPETTFLGSYFDGNFFDQQLDVIQLNPAVEIEWAVTSGQLPPGLTLNSAGVITGYLEPVELIGRYGPSGYDGTNTAQIGTTATMSNCTISGATLTVGSFSGSIQSQMYLTGANVATNTYIVASLGGNRYTIAPSSNVTISDTTIIGTVLNANQEQQYDTGPYQFNQLSQNVAYTFTVQAFDGANYDLQTYVINVVSRPNYTADSSLSIDDVYLTVDSGNVYIPVIRNTSTILPAGRQDAYYAAKIDGYDFDVGTENLTYRIVNTAGTYDGSPFDPLNRDDLNNGLPGSFDFVSSTVSNLPGVNLDSDSGWIFGKINPQTSAYEEFDFGIEVCKTVGYGSASNITLSINANVTVNTTQFITQRFANSTPSANLSVLANVSSSTIYVTPVSGNVTLLDNSLWVSNSSSLSATVTNTSFYQVEYCSRPTYFTLPVVGDPNSIITWTSPLYLGTIDNGTVSELRVEAVSAIGAKITYSLVDERGVSCRLPQGLILLPTGEIAGRATFESFSVDDHTTTFDNELLVVDRTATFRVKAETVDGSASSTRTFTLKLNLIDTEPYENLYLKAMPPVSKRQMYNSLISDSSIFNETSIYRPNDTNFGVQKDLTMLFLPGLSPSELTEYQTAMIENHFTKTYTFGNIKVAYVLDALYEIKYEVVYVEVVDPGENDLGAGPAQSTDLSGIIDNPYISQDGTAYNIIYPNSSENMTRRMEEIVGYQDQSSLPPWMTSNQPDATTATGFTIPLGYTKAVVIAHAQPGQGEKIAYKIRKSNFDFNQIEFIVDRYQIDNYYSSNYSISTGSYIRDRETTFDSDQNINVGTIVASVTYAVDVPYNQINGRPVEYILANGGIDGIDNFADGETIIFTKQEQFEDPGPYDGWVDYSASYIGDNTETTTVEGYDSGSYDTYTVVPGFLEKSQGTSTVNRRGGIWRIEITNGIVNLAFVQEITVYERVRVLFGKTLSSAVLTYSLDLVPGQTVPFYKVFISNPALRIRTTFNNDTTKFFTRRDQYYEPGSEDKYVKFPQYGVFT
jgi:hypothetical protein